MFFRNKLHVGRCKINFHWLLVKKWKREKIECDFQLIL